MRDFIDFVTVLAGMVFAGLFCLVVWWFVITAVLAVAS